MNKARVRYVVRIPEPSDHTVHVQMSVDEAPEGGTLLAMPVWTPGSYLVREYARHVSHLTAKRAGGEAVPVTKVDKNTWRVDAKPGKRVDVSYRVYANELSVRTSHVDADHAYLQPAATFLFVRGREKEPCEVTVVPPEGWSVTCPLPFTGENAFRADDLDLLVDSPVEVGPHRLFTFEVCGVPHRIALHGEGNADFEEFVADAHTVCRTAAALFGDDHPCRSYTFLWHVLDGAGGGLEHLDSCVCGFPPFSFRPRRAWLRALGLVAHEYFHLWNVKRIRPRELGPFDYDRENYTRLLWMAEGFTTYYGERLLRDAGLAPVPVFLDEMARMIRTFAETPGREVDTVEGASFDTWIKFYRPHENLRNVTVSYYLKGGLVALLLDLTIRDATDGKRSLDDAMRALWAQYRARPEQGFTEEELLAVLDEAAGRSLAPEIGAWVKGTGPLPIEETLAKFGLRLAGRDADGEAKPWLGIVPGDGGKVKEVLAGSPALAGGLDAGDELLALDGWRLGDLAERLAERKPGDEVLFTVSRRGRLREVKVVLGEPLGSDRSLRPREDAGDREKRLFASWLGEPLSTAAVAPPAPPKEAQPRAL